ncbi:MAG: hypothetical protein EOM19_01090 [Candidatus Moranbacteria bacterium]|nr:hypothetical protein [Candidatus Moranbacteria bacterium]
MFKYFLSKMPIPNKEANSGIARQAHYFCKKTSFLLKEKNVATKVKMVVCIGRSSNVFRTKFVRLTISLVAN